MIFVGVDGGKTGAIAVLNGPAAPEPFACPVPVITGATKKSRPEYDLAAIRELFYQFGPLADQFVTVERPGPISPKVKAGSLAQYQRGVTEGWAWMLTALRISFQLVRPVDWMKPMHAGCNGDDTKQKSILAAQRLFPGVDLRRTERSRKADDGMAEALLLADYGRRTVELRTHIEHTA